MSVDAPDPSPPPEVGLGEEIEVETLETQTVLLASDEVVEYDDDERSESPSGSRLCLVCYQKLGRRDGERMAGAGGLPRPPPKFTLLEFCSLLKVGVPPRCRITFQGLDAPLCPKCVKVLENVKNLLCQIGELERSLASARIAVKEQLVASWPGGTGSVAGDRKDEGGLSEVANAVNSIRNCIKRDFIDASSRPVADGSDALPRKVRGKQLGKRKRTVCSSPDEKLAESVSHRSSFGRVVKKPRYFMMSDEESGGEMDEIAEKKFDPSQSHPGPVVSVSTVKIEPSTLTHQPSGGVQPSASTKQATGNSNVTTLSISSKTEPAKLEVTTGAQGDSEGEFHVDRSDTNWSDGDVSEEGMKKSPKKAIKRKRKPVKKQSLHKGQVKLIGINGEELGTSVIKDGKVVINDAFHKKLVGGTAVVRIDKDVLGMRVKCDKCTRTFTDVKKMQTHVRRFHDGIQIFECKSCEKQFEKLKDLIYHRKAAHPPKEPKADEGGKKTFECEFCKIVFKNQADLHIHRRNHTGERPFKCDVCNEGFISKGRYEVHVEVNHPESCPLKCEYCPRSFFRHHRLRDHKKSHTGERPYLCEICSKSFSQPAYLKYHQTKHKELNLAEFKCDECDKKFASPVNLKFHKETQHQKKYRFHCDVCGHGATHKSHLKLHMRKHTGERPHSCPHCGKSFSRGSQLKIHIRSHTGERPYICSTCSKSFTNSSKLRRHELTHLSTKKKRAPIVKVSSLAGPQTPSTSSASTTNVKFLHEVVNLVEEDSEQQQVLKFELPDENGIQQQLITIEQANGVTYQVIATDDVSVIDEPYTEYIVLNGDFTIA